MGALSIVPADLNGMTSWVTQRGVREHKCGFLGGILEKICVSPPFFVLSFSVSAGNLFREMSKCFCSFSPETKVLVVFYFLLIWVGFTFFW